MKWDAFVYARGVQRTDGYKMRVQPENFPASVIQGCQAFFNMRSVNEKRCSWKDIFEKDPDVWKKSFMFTAQPKYNSCLLVRAVKVEANQNGEILVDFENRDVWSWEGLWCPYEKLNIMFASLPSILMWLANCPVSLRTYFSGRSESSIDIGDGYGYNPYSDSAVFPPAFEGFKTLEEKSAVISLAQKIKFSGKPFSFAFGPLSEMIMTKCADIYGIKNSFSTVDPSSLDTAFDDPFAGIKKAELSELNVNTETKTYVLRLCNELQGRKDRFFRWCISEKTGISSYSEILSGTPIPFDEQQGLNFVRLKAEAETVRIFARNIQWTVQQHTSDERIMYTFCKEERIT